MIIGSSASHGAGTRSGCVLTNYFESSSQVSHQFFYLALIGILFNTDIAGAEWHQV